MATKVEIGRTRGFVLDDPVAGVLDNTEYGLGGLGFVDVSEYVRALNISRGKNRDLDRYSSGSLQVALNNQTRYFDPFAGTAIDPIPRVPIRVSYNDVVQFYGIVDDWDYTYEPGGVSYATVKASDELTKLARQFVLSAGTAEPELSGARVSQVLDMFTVDWPTDKRQIDTGDSQLCTSEYTGQNALEYLQLVETSEQGQLFIGKTGDLVFRSRSASTPRSAGLVTFADDGTGIDYRRVYVNYGTELMVNRATVNAPLVTATANNELSQVTYGVIATEIDTLCAPGAVVQNIADYTVAKYANPEYRFDALVLDITRLPSVDIAAVMDIELGDVVDIKFTPNDIGDPIQQYAQVIGIEYEVEVDTFDVIFRLASLDFTSLVLDDTEFGKLNEYTLGY